MATRGPSELGGWSGVASIQRKLERSVTITMNREAIAYQMLAMASAQITATRSRCCGSWRRRVACWIRRRVTVTSRV